MAQWETHEIIGRGSTAIAYRATRHVCREHHQEACRKELKEELQADRESVDAFRREAAINADLRHPNIVSLIDADLDNHYIVLELVDGCDLRRILEANGRLTAPQTAYIAIELCRALEYAHTRTRGDEPAPVIHRDLSPKNVLIAHAGNVKLMDFGIAARSVEPATSVRGTPGYMSPEHHGHGVLDGRSDLYSLGVIMYELLTGMHPHAVARSSEMHVNTESGRRLKTLSEIVPNAPAALVSIVDKLRSMNPDERFCSASDLLEALAPLAPSPLVARSLGELALKAYRRETKDYGALRAQRLSRASQPPASAVAVEAVAETVSTPLVPKRRLPPRWALVSAGIAVPALFVAMTSPDRLTKAVQAEVAPAKSPAPQQSRMQNVEQAAPGDSTVSPLAETAITTKPAAAAVEPTALTQPSLTAVAHQAPDNQSGSSPRSPARASAAMAMLHVSTSPPAQVWIDDRLVGKSPVHTRVTAGKTHVIAAGDDERSQAKRRVTLRANEEHDEIFDLTKR